MAQSRFPHHFWAGGNLQMTMLANMYVEHDVGQRQPKSSTSTWATSSRDSHLRPLLESRDADRDSRCAVPHRLADHQVALRVTDYGFTMKLKTLLMRLDLLSSEDGVWPCVCGFFAIIYKSINHLPFTIYHPFWRTSVMNQHLCEGSFRGKFSSRIPFCARHRRSLWRVWSWEL